MKGTFDIEKHKAELEATTKELTDLFGGIIPQFVKESGGILFDNVRFWRWKNQVNIIKKAKKFLEENNLQKNPVSLKVLVPLLEASSLEEDQTMQDKWANLLTNAISNKLEIRPNYVEILKELSPIEVLLLDKIYEEARKESDYQKRLSLNFDKQKICDWLKLSSEKFDVLIENLFRLNLCRMPGATGIMFGNNKVAVHTTNLFELTSMGFDFVKACRNNI